MAATRKVIALSDKGLQELVTEVVVGIPGTGANSEVHNSGIAGNASGDGSFSANEGFVEGDLAFAANEGQAAGLKAFAANYATAPGAGAFAANAAQAPGDRSSAFGIGGIAHIAQTVCGVYPVNDLSSDVGFPASDAVLFRVGNGATSDTPDRSDAFHVKMDGTAYHAKRISYGIWNGYAEGPVDFTGGLSGGGNIPTNGANVLGNAPVLKGSRTISNDIANMAAGDAINFEWLGRIVHTSGGALYFRDLNATSYTQIMYINTLASGTYYAKVTGKYIVSQIVADVPQIKLEWNIELRSGDGYANPMVVAINDSYATQDSGGGALYPISSPLTFAFGINAANATRPKQISFRMWRE